MPNINFLVVKNSQLCVKDNNNNCVLHDDLKYATYGATKSHVVKGSTGKENTKYL